MLTILLGTLAVFSAGSDTTWRCFELRYPGVASDQASIYPYRLALQGKDSGAVVSRARGGDKEFWWMFRNVHARWNRFGAARDSLSVSFNNGYTWVGFDLAERGDSLVGRGAIHYDFGDPDQHPRFPIVGRVGRCKSADLQGPERDPEALKQARAYAAWEELQASELRRVAALDIPFAGTWRFVAEADGAPAAVVYGRTSLRPDGLATALFSRDTAASDTYRRRPAEGVWVHMAVARDTIALSGSHLHGDTPPVMSAGFSVRERPLSRSDDSTVWQANADVVQALSRLATSEGSRDGPWAKASRAIHEIFWEGRPGRIEGWITVRSDGSANFRLVVERAGRRVVQVTGERIGTQALSDPTPVGQR